MEKFIELLKNFKILYCEDEADIRNNLLNILHRRTENVIHAEDGAEGLAKFKEHSPDIIISDIQMPNMSGLEMIAEIKKINPDIPVIVTTAFSDQNYFIDSIELGIDKYLIKPIKKESIISALEKTVYLLEDKRVANQYRIQKELEKIKENTESLMSQFTESFPSPILLMKGNSIAYVNQSFHDLAGSENVRKLLDGDKQIEEFLEKRDGFCDSIFNLNYEAPYYGKISVHTQKGRRIFKVSVKEIQLDDAISTLYIFTDITIIEYQKLKIKHYNLRLEDYILRTKYKLKDDAQIKEIEDRIEEEQETRELSKDEANILRKSHIDKITASEFVERIDPALFEEIDELADLEDEFDSVLIDFTNNPSNELLLNLVGKFDKYAFVVKGLDEFNELSQALFSTRDVLSKITELDEKTVKTAAMFIENIVHDLINWRKTIFVEKTTVDIHYLDSSLFSSCLQLELSLTGVKPEDDEDDLELF